MTNTRAVAARLAMFGRALPGLPRYVRDWRAYQHAVGAPRLRFVDALPHVNDRTDNTPIDAHYFYQGAWATDRVVSSAAPLHVDVGSQLSLAAALAAMTTVVFIDIRPPLVTLPRLHALSADGTRLPFRDGSIQSLSCLHVAEHVGLGRYGDPLDPLGSERLCRELARVLAPGGRLLLSVPIGRPRVRFNAHRVFAPADVSRLLAPLELVEFSAVSDSGRFERDADPTDFQDAGYSCGLYEFKR